jgi:hypothetical protein
MMLPTTPSLEEIQALAPRIGPVPDRIHRPFWSGIVPTYNNSRYLRRTSESVLCQALGPDEMQSRALGLLRYWRGDRVAVRDHFSALPVDREHGWRDGREATLARGDERYGLCSRHHRGGPTTIGAYFSGPVERAARGCLALRPQRSANLRTTDAIDPRPSSGPSPSRSDALCCDT